MSAYLTSSADVNLESKDVVPVPHRSIASGGASGGIRATVESQRLPISGAPARGEAPGAAYSWLRSGTTWPERHRVVAEDGFMGHEFGFAVAIDGGQAVFSALQAQHVYVERLNYQPIAVTDSYVTNAGTAKSRGGARALANDTDGDGDTLFALKMSNPRHGTVTMSTDGSFTYTPDLALAGRRIRGFNALLATASIEAAMRYYLEFKQQQETLTASSTRSRPTGTPSASATWKRRPTTRSRSSATRTLARSCC
jgi:hypothetical protein